MKAQGSWPDQGSTQSSVVPGLLTLSPSWCHSFQRSRKFRCGWTMVWGVVEETVMVLDLKNCVGLRVKGIHEAIQGDGTELWKMGRNKLWLRWCSWFGCGRVYRQKSSKRGIKRKKTGSGWYQVKETTLASVSQWEPQNDFKEMGIIEDTYWQDPNYAIRDLI